MVHTSFKDSTFSSSDESWEESVCSERCLNELKEDKATCDYFAYGLLLLLLLLFLTDWVLLGMLRRYYELSSTIITGHISTSSPIDTDDSLS